MGKSGWKVAVSEVSQTEQTAKAHGEVDIKLSKSGSELHLEYDAEISWEGGG